MSEIGHNTGVAHDQLRSVIERIERLEEEKAAIAADIKEVYAEAKANGFDTKTLREIVRIRKMDKAERDEQEAMLEMYMGALGMLFDAQPDESQSGPSTRDGNSSAGTECDIDRRLIPESAASVHPSEIARATSTEAAQGDGATLLPASSPDKFQAKASEGETDTTASKCGVGGLASRESGGSDSVASIYAGSASSLHVATTVAPGTHPILAGLTAGEGSSGEDGSPEPRTSPLHEIQGRAAE